MKVTAILYANFTTKSLFILMTHFVKLSHAIFMT